MTPKQRQEMFRRFQAKNPHPTTELIYSSPFELLVSVLLSAQATDVSVNKATTILFSKANTPQAIVDLGIDGLKQYIKSIGLYNTKAENLMKTCRLLVDRFDSHIPDNRDDLESLPGVGRKTANVILNTAFGQPTMAVDTHIFRVANRTGLAPGKNVLEVEQALLKNVPTKFRQHAHHWLILHGRYTCVARNPHCAICIIHDLCDYYKKRDE